MLDCSVKILRTEGPLAFFQGVVPPIVGNAPVNAVVFAATAWTRRQLDQHVPPAAGHYGGSTGGGHPDLVRSYIAGTVGGVMQTFVTSPVELAKCCMQRSINLKASLAVQGDVSLSLAKVAAEGPHYLGAWDVLRQQVSCHPPYVAEWPSRHRFPTDCSLNFCTCTGSHKWGCAGSLPRLLAHAVARWSFLWCLLCHI